MSAVLKLASEPELSPARAALAEAIAQVAAVSPALDRAEQPVQRLQKIIAERDRLDRRLAEFDQQLTEATGEWLAAGSIGERPTLPAAAVGVRQRRAEMAADAAAARLALPDALAARQAAAERVRLAGKRRDEAIAIAAGEAAQGMVPKLTAALSEVSPA